jgi:CHASE2 domain-containing sensor protein
VATDRDDPNGRALYFAFKHGLSAFLLGLIVSVISIWAIVLAPHNPLSQAGLDAAMWLHAGATAPHPPARYVILDLDDATCAAWRRDDPTACEGDAARLLERYATTTAFAASAGAAAIVLDVDLSRSSRGGPAVSAGESALRDAVLGSSSPVFAPLPLRPIGVDALGRPRFRSLGLLLEDAGTDAGEPAHIQYGHVVWRPDADGVLRRPLPCVFLADDVSAQQATPLRGLGAVVASAIGAEAPHTSNDSSCAEPSSAPPLVFAIPHRPAVLRSLLGGSWVVEGAPLLSTYSMMRVTAGMVDPEALQGAVVLIGSSRVDNGDWHATPLGQLPGLWIVLNHIHAELNYEPLVLNVPHLVVEKLVITASLSLLIGVFWYLVARQSKKRGWPRLLQLLSIAGGYVVVVVIALAGVVFYVSALARPALAHGYIVEPLTPALAVMFETTIDGIRYVLERIERLSALIIRSLARLAKRARPHIEAIASRAKRLGVELVDAVRKHRMWRELTQRLRRSQRAAASENPESEP